MVSTSVNGCDSIEYLDLTILSSSTSNTNVQSVIPTHGMEILILFLVFIVILTNSVGM